MHWTKRYVGKPYIQGEYECPHLVQEALSREFGIEVELPKVNWRRTKPETLAELCSPLAERTERPVKGCGVLMRVQGHWKSLGSHVGLYSPVSGQGWVLHTMRRTGAIFVPLSSIHLYALELVGFYRWKTA